MNKTVLFTNHQLAQYAGSELVIFDLANAFRSLGFEVTIATFMYDYPIKSQFEAEQLNVINCLNNDLTLKNYDLIWAHHTPVLYHVLFEQKVTAKHIVTNSLSPYEPLESPPIFANDLTLSLANSEETKKELLSLGINEDKIMVFLNSVPDEYYNWYKEKNTPELTKIVVVSNHVPEEIRDTITILQSKDIIVDVLGIEGKFELVTATKLSEYDAVITIGRTVQHSLSLGIPVYCYDHFGGPGWIVAENLDKAETYNFSGRCTNRKFDAINIFEDITSGFNKAFYARKSLYSIAKERYSLSTNVASILSRLVSSNKVIMDDIYKYAAINRHNLYYVRELRKNKVLSEEAKRQNAILKQKDDALNNIYRSNGWKLLQKYYRLKAFSLKKINCLLNFRYSHHEKRFTKNINGKPISRQVDVIVPIYNAYDNLVSCVESILKNTTIPYRLILINDCSSDPGIELYLKQLEKRGIQQLVVLRNKKNLGFVGTVNRGISESQSDVVLLNSDTEVPPGWLERLSNLIEIEPMIGTLTPFSNNATICSFPNFCQDNALPDGFDVISLDGVFKRWAPHVSIELPTAVGFCMLITRQCLNDVGLFDEQTFGRGYGEENDFCMRAKAKGYQNLLCPDLFVYHKGSMSFGIQQKKLAQENMQNLLRKHPKYLSLVRLFIKRDPIKPIRQIIQSGLNISTDRLGVLIVTHSLGGGTERHIEDLVNELEKDFRIYILKSYPGRLEFIDRNCHQQLVYQFSLKDCFKDAEWFGKLVKTFDVGLIHVHHLIGYPLNFFKMIELSGIPYLYTAHDFYAACPSYNLMNHRDEYCNSESNEEICQKCLKLKNYRINNNIVVITDWRSKWSEFLREAKAVIVPSQFTKEIFSRYYPSSKFKVIEHGVNQFVTMNDVVKPLSLTKQYEHCFKLRVGLLGAIGPQKGSLLLEKLLQETKKQNLPIQWVVIGYTDKRSLPLSSNCGRLVIHGKYKKDEIKSLLKSYQVDLILFANTCPETYSYTLSEAWLAGYPVMAPDLGALGYRAKETGTGWVLSTFNEQTIIDLLKNMINNPSEIIKARKNLKNVIIPSVQQMGIQYMNLYLKHAENKQILETDQVFSSEYLYLAAKQFYMQSYYSLGLEFLRRIKNYVKHVMAFIQ